MSRPEPENTVISQERLDAAIAKHQKYMRGQMGGARANFKFCILDGLDFRGANLTGSEFTGSSFVKAILDRCTFDQSNFYACDLRETSMNGASFRRADFRGAYIADARVENSDFTSVDMREGRMMKKAKGRLHNKTMANGEEALVSTSFERANIKNSNFTGAKAYRTDFSGADMTGVRMVDADLRKAKFEETNLSGADLTGSDLRSAKLVKSILSGANLEWISTDSETDFKDSIRAEDKHTDIYHGQKSLDELLSDHIAFVNSAGAIGKQLKISGRDMTESMSLRRFSLTALVAKECDFSYNYQKCAESTSQSHINTHTHTHTHTHTRRERERAIAT